MKRLRNQQLESRPALLDIPDSPLNLFPPEPLQPPNAPLLFTSSLHVQRLFGYSYHQTWFNVHLYCLRLDRPLWRFTHFMVNRYRAGAHPIHPDLPTVLGPTD